MHPLALIAALALAVCAESGALGGDYKVDKTKVYYGRADSFKKPGTVEKDRVFADISAYKKIKKEGLKRKHPRYWLLLQEANEVFSRALTKVATDGGYDLIAEKGSVKPRRKGKAPPDLTAAAIKAVKKVEKES